VETRTRAGFEAEVNTTSMFSRIRRLRSGGGSGGAGSGALARMNSGSGARTSPRPHADSASATPANNTTLAMTRRIPPASSPAEATFRRLAAILRNPRAPRLINIC
jgi:hypothetical protein